MAQETDIITVTAQKREQNIQDVPIAVSAFSGQFLDDSGIKDVFDLQQYAPGLILSQSQSSTRTSFIIRGVGTSSNNFGLESSVGLFVDGVFRQRQGSLINELVDVERVEILRGPQGSLFGKNTAAGAITFTSAAPEFEFGGWGEIQYGNLDYFSARGAVTGPVIDNVLAMRATGFYAEREGYIENISTGNDVNNRDRFGARFQLLFTPNEDVDVRFIADYSEQNEICCAAGTLLNGPSDFAVTALGGTILDGADFFDRRVTANFDPVADIQDWGVSAEINWDIPGHTITSITGYREFDSFDSLDADFTDLDILRDSFNDLRQNAFTQELRIASTGDSKLQYVAGVYYFKQNLDSDTGLISGAFSNVYLNLTTGGLVPLAIDFPPGSGNIIPVDWFPAGEGSLNQMRQDHESWAVFGQVDYSVTDDLILTGGIRYTSETKDLVGTFTESIPLGPNPLIDPAGAFIPGAGYYLFPPLAPTDDIDVTLDEGQVTGTAKITYYFTEDSMVYGSYGRGFKSGGTNTDRVPPLAPLIFDPEISNSYEIGTKNTLFDGKARVNLAGYYTTYDDFQSNTFVGTGFFLQNAGKIETYGGELEIFANPADWLTTTAAVAYTKAVYDSFVTGPCQIVSPDPAPNGDGSCDRTGDRVPGAPEWTFIGTATAEQPITDTLLGYLRTELTYYSDIMTDTNNDPLKVQDAQVIVNLRLGLQTDNIDFSIWTRNVFDDEAFIIAFDPPIQDGKLNAYPNVPRTYGVTARVNF